MNTRTEKINNKVYCAYCGKELKNYDYDNSFVHVISSSNTYNSLIVCDCEKAKFELELCKQLKELYNLPLSEILIDIKVEQYRNELLKKNKSTTVTGCTITSPVSPVPTLEGTAGDWKINNHHDCIDQATTLL